MRQRLALKLAACLCAFLWAFVSIEHRWGFTVTLGLVIVALAFGASAAKDLGRMGAVRDDQGRRGG